MEVFIPLMVQYVFMGILGGVTRVLVHIYNYGIRKVGKKKDRYIVHVPLGAVAGLLSWYAVEMLRMTNHLTAFFAGYFAPSFLQHLAKKKEWGE